MAERRPGTGRNTLVIDAGKREARYYLWPDSAPEELGETLDLDTEQLRN